MAKRMDKWNWGVQLYRDFRNVHGFSKLPTCEQTSFGPGRQQKPEVATNVAETSVTLPVTQEAPSTRFRIQDSRMKVLRP